jgi:hypothetical protein
MAVVPSLRCNIKLKGFYDLLIANHKPIAYYYRCFGLKRLIERELQNSFARIILGDEISSGTQVKVTVKDNN